MDVPTPFITLSRGAHAPRDRLHLGAPTAHSSAATSSVSPAEATLDGGGWWSTDSALMVNRGSTGGTVEYLTIQNYVLNERRLAGTADRCGRWRRAGPTSTTPSGPTNGTRRTSGQNANGGYAIDGGSTRSSSTAASPRIRRVPSTSTERSPRPPSSPGTWCTHNEISDNGLGKYPDPDRTPTSVAARAAAKHSGPSTCNDEQLRPRQLQRRHLAGFR